MLRLCSIDCAEQVRHGRAVLSKSPALRGALFFTCGARSPDPLELMLIRLENARAQECSRKRSRPYLGWS
jgi:hypothetical protein